MSWRVSSAPSGVPSVAQSDQSSLYDRAVYIEKYAPKKDAEKQQDDFIPPEIDPLNVAASLPAASQPSMTRTREAAFILLTCVSQFLSLSALNQTVAPVLVLADYFHVEDYGTLSWFSASFSMSVGTFILPAGTLPVYCYCVDIVGLGKLLLCNERCIWSTSACVFREHGSLARSSAAFLGPPVPRTRYPH